MSSKSKERQDMIYNQIMTAGKISIKTLSQQFNVSRETIRNDLNHLHELGLINKTHGGAESISYQQVDMAIKVTNHPDEKDFIGRKAVSMVTDNSIIWLGPGSTALAIARYLPLLKNCLIVTNCLDVAKMAISSKNEVLITGGKIQKKGGCAVGGFTLENISAISFDYAFIGCDGFVGSDGPTTFSFEEMEVKKAIIRQSKKKYLICDSSKFGLTGTYIFAHLNQFDAIITETNPGGTFEKHVPIICQ